MRIIKVITRIEVQQHNKNRVSIFLDEEYAFSIALETAMKHSLKKGMELDDCAIKSLILESDQRTALDQAVNYLSQRLKTKQQMIDYVKKHGFDDIIVQYVIEKLEEYHYIDDQNYVEKYITTYLGKVGKKKIEYDLLKKGIHKQLIQSALHECEVDEEDVYYLAKKKLGTKQLDQKEKEKLFRYLAGKGFSYEESKKAIVSLAKGDEDESWD